jgi:hypothetical protein
MTNTHQSTLFRHGIARSVSSGRVLALLAFVGFLLILISAPAGRSPDSTAMQSAPPKTTEDWRGNSASIRPYDG